MGFCMRAASALEAIWLWTELARRLINGLPEAGRRQMATQHEHAALVAPAARCWQLQAEGTQQAGGGARVGKRICY